MFSYSRFFIDYTSLYGTLLAHVQGKRMSLGKSVKVPAFSTKPYPPPNIVMSNLQDAFLDKTVDEWSGQEFRRYSSTVDQ